MWRRRSSESVVHDEVPEYWIAYSDLIVSLLMVFALLLFLALARWQADVENVARIRDRANDAITKAAEEAANAGVKIRSADGAIIIDEDVLFAFNSAALDSDGWRLVEKLATQFLPDALANPELESMVEAIEIEGHTDTTGTYMFNLGLSQQRANAVMEGILTASDPRIQKRLQNLLVASGRSETRPFMIDSQIDNRGSRRIEIHFRLRNDMLVDSILRLIAGRNDQ